MAKASRRALTVLGLFEGPQPSWRIHHVDFEIASRLILGDMRWRVDRSIAVTNAGTWASVSMSTSRKLVRKQREMMESDRLAQFRRSIEQAGFEDRCPLDDRTPYVSFIRRVESPKLVNAEWKFLNELSVARALHGGELPVRPKAPIVAVKEVDGQADRLFAALRKNQPLMSHLHRVSYERAVRHTVDDELWVGWLRLIGDPFCIHAVAQFRPEGSKDEAKGSRTLARIRRAMKQQGYEDVRRIVFSKHSLGPVSLRREKAFFDKLSIQDLLR